MTGSRLRQAADGAGSMCGFKGVSQGRREQYPQRAFSSEASSGP